MGKKKKEKDYNLYCEGVFVSFSVSMVRQIPLFRVKLHNGYHNTDYAN